MARAVQRIPAPRTRRVRGAARTTFTRIAQLFAVIACVALLVTAVYYGTRIERFQIKNVVIIGGETVSHDEMRNVVDDVLAGTYFGLVPKRFAYTYPVETLRLRLQEMSRVHAVRVFLPETQTLRIEFREYLPYALWCDDIVRESTCFFVDVSGHAFASAGSIRGSLYARVTFASSTPSQDAKFPNPEALREAVSVRAMLRAVPGITTDRVAMTAEGDMLLLTPSDALIQARVTDSATSIHATLMRIFETDSYAYLLEDGFQSIDVRFGNRVYVKDMRAVETESVSTTTATSTEQ